MTATVIPANMAVHGILRSEADLWCTKCYDSRYPETIWMYEVPFVRELCLEKLRNGDPLVGGVHRWSKTGEDTGNGYRLTPWQLQARRFTEAPLLTVPGWTDDDTLNGTRGYNDVRATFGQIGECIPVTEKKEQNRGFDFRFWRGWPDKKQAEDQLKIEVKSRSEIQDYEELYIQVAEKWDDDVRKMVMRQWNNKLQKGATRWQTTQH